MRQKILLLQQQKKHLLYIPIKLKPKHFLPFNSQKDERLEARLGFAGSIPCAQTHGADKFYSADDGDNPEDLLIAGEYSDLPIFFGANTHEGSYVYGGKWTTIVC